MFAAVGANDFLLFAGFELRNFKKRSAAGLYTSDCPCRSDYSCHNFNSIIILSGWPAAQEIPELARNDKPILTKSYHIFALKTTKIGL